MENFYVDPDDPSVFERLKDLKPYPGYCAFIDIVGSTSLKDDHLREWVRVILNVFENAKAYLAHTRVLKTIGDELMYYVPEGSIAPPESSPPGSPAGAEVHILFAGLTSVAREPDPIFERVKVAVAYCTDAYPLTFVKGCEDVYGKDIDLTARLKSRANPRDIVMNEAFYKKLLEARDYFGADQCPEVEHIVGPWPESFKGFKSPVSVYKLPSQ